MISSQYSDLEWTIGGCSGVTYSEDKKKQDIEPDIVNLCGKIIAVLRHSYLTDDNFIKVTEYKALNISIDCKKKENIGSFKNNGAEYCPKKETVKVLDHDLPMPGLGKAVPYGIYDAAQNEGDVNHPSGTRLSIGCSAG